MEVKRGEVSFALANITTRFKDDGTRIFVTLELAESEPAKFYVNYEGLSSLILYLMGCAQKMARTMVESGEAQKYNVSERPINPMRALSCQGGRDPKTNQIILSVQTEEGPLVDLAFSEDMREALLELLSQTAPMKGGGTPSTTIQ